MVLYFEDHMLEDLDEDDANLIEEETQDEDDTDETGEEEEEEAGDEGEAGDEEGSEEAAEYINQEAVNKAIGKQHRKYREEQRAHLATQKALKEAQEKLAELNRAEAPVVPPVPDGFDPQYAEKMAARDKAIADLTQHNADQRAAQQNVQKTREQEFQQKQQQIQSAIEGFARRAKSVGITPEESAQNEEVVIAYGVRPEVAEYLLGEEEGPIIVKYLARNLEVLEKVSTMSPLRASSYLKTKVEPEAIKLKPKATGAPNPLKKVKKGKGSDPNKEYMDGVILE